MRVSDPFRKQLLKYTGKKYMSTYATLANVKINDTVNSFNDYKRA